RAADAALERQAGDEATACARAASELLEHADDDLAADVGDVLAAKAQLAEKVALGAQMSGHLEEALVSLHQAAQQRTDPHDRAYDTAQELLAPVPPAAAHIHVTELDLLQSGRRGDRARRDRAMAQMTRLAEATGSMRARGVVEYGRVAHEIDDGQLTTALARL